MHNGIRLQTSTPKASLKLIATWKNLGLPKMKTFNHLWLIDENYITDAETHDWLVITFKPSGTSAEK